MKHDLFQFIFGYTVGRGFFVTVINTTVLWLTRSEVESWIKFGILITTFLIGIGTLIKLYFEIAEYIKSRKGKAFKSKNDQGNR